MRLFDSIRNMALIEAPRYHRRHETLQTPRTETLRQRYQRVQARSEITLKPCLLDDTQGQLLQLASGSGGQMLERLCRDANGTAVEYDREYWRPDAVEIRLEVGPAQGSSLLGRLPENSFQ